MEELFSEIGKVKTISASEISQENIRNYDVLMVRTVTRVDSVLLKNTKIKIVCSMTSGIDHIDERFLKNQNIKLVYAPGANARSVAEYVIASLLIIAKRKKISLQEKTIGVIGVGNVGTKVVQMCTALGMKVLLRDPPKYNRTKNKKYLSLKKPSDAEIITLHVPLTFNGKYKTYHMVDDDFFACLKKGTIFINTSRGSVVDEYALKKYHKKLDGLVLDVWENEPNIDTELIKIVDIGTPHIAGYSLDGKLNATFMVCKKLCKILNKDFKIKKEKILPPLNKELKIYPENENLLEILNSVVLKIYNPVYDHQRLIKMLNLKPEKRGRYFEYLRQNYPVRREFSNFCPVLNDCPERIREVLKGLGFRMKN